jgi:HPt (histidine-containing phosphotransfer) domain-containing protein
LGRLHALDPDGRLGVVQRVLQTFHASLQRLLAQVAAEAQQPQPEALRAVAHQLKSSAAAVGALPLAALCGEIESAIRSGDLSRTAPDAQRLLDEGARALQAVEAMLRP